MVVLELRVIENRLGLAVVLVQVIVGVLEKGSVCKVIEIELRIDQAKLRDFNEDLLRNHVVNKSGIF